MVDSLRSSKHFSTRPVGRSPAFQLPGAGSLPVRGIELLAFINHSQRNHPSVIHSLADKPPGEAWRRAEMLKCYFHRLSRITGGGSTGSSEISSASSTRRRAGPAILDSL